MVTTRIQIKDAEGLAEARDQQAVVIIGVERDGTVTVVSYGENKPKCDSIGEWAQGLWRNAVSAVPFQTRFGWGNSGVPKPLTAAELAQLGPNGRAFAQRHGGVQ